MACRCGLEAARRARPACGPRRGRSVHPSRRRAGSDGESRRASPSETCARRSCAPPAAIDVKKLSSVRIERHAVASGNPFLQETMAPCAPWRFMNGSGSVLSRSVSAQRGHQRLIVEIERKLAGVIATSGIFTPSSELDGKNKVNHVERRQPELHEDRRHRLWTDRSTVAREVRCTMWSTSFFTTASISDCTITALSNSRAAAPMEVPRCGRHLRLSIRTSERRWRADRLCGQYTGVRDLHLSLRFTINAA